MDPFNGERKHDWEGEQFSSAPFAPAVNEVIECF